MTDDAAIRPRDAAILRLRRRGLKQKDIAAVLGVTHQAVSQRLQRYPPIEVHAKRPTQVAAKVVFTCAKCGRTAWLTESERKTGGHQRLRQYCSQRCMGLAAREVNEADVLWAIEMRLEGAMTWKTIASRLGCTAQNVQRRIWHHLKAKDLLTVRQLRAIWEPTTSEYRYSPSWGWLQRTERYQPRAEP